MKGASLPGWRISEIVDKECIKVVAKIWIVVMDRAGLSSVVVIFHILMKIIVKYYLNVTAYCNDKWLSVIGSLTSSEQVMSQLLLWHLTFCAQNNFKYFVAEKLYANYV